MNSARSSLWLTEERVNGSIINFNTSEVSANQEGGKLPINYDLRLALGSSKSVESIAHSEITHNSMWEMGKFEDCRYPELTLGMKHGSGSDSQNCSSSSLADGNVGSVSSGHEFLDIVVNSSYSTPGSTRKPSLASQRVSFSSSDDSLGVYAQPQLMGSNFSDDSDSVSAMLCNDVFVNSPGAPGIMTDEGSTSAAKRMKLRNSSAHGLFDAGHGIDLHHCTYPAAHTEGSTKAGNLSSDKSHCLSLVSEPSTASHLGASGNRSKKMCKFPGCSKGSRGASGLCIMHGGGRRCQKPNCTRGAESRTNFCKTHGGGPRCQVLGCLKSAEGKTDFCIAHGGGHRCSFEGCTKAARGRSGKCIKHGGGKRCQKEGCTRSAEGLSGLCISHGGGRRCQFLGCGKGAQGSTMFCKGHGGGKRCVHEGCTKGAEGSTMLCKAHGGGKRCTFGGGACTKSVHGGTLFCVAHGGGKRCSFPGCTKSARGRTDCCVRHGGGKRCKVENCSKSAQGSTDFCKAHGGGKRCREGAVIHVDGAAVPDKLSRSKKSFSTTHCRTMQELVTNTVSSSCNMVITTSSIPVLQEQYIKSVSSTSDKSRLSTETSDRIGKGMGMETVYGHNVPVATVSPAHAENIIAPYLVGMTQKMSSDDPSRFSMSSLERRVHGGSLMALLQKKQHNGHAHLH